MKWVKEHKRLLKSIILLFENYYVKITIETFAHS